MRQPCEWKIKCVGGHMGCEQRCKHNARVNDRGVGGSWDSKGV